MKTQYTAELVGHPGTRIETDVSVAGEYIPSHKELAASAAIDAAQNYAEPEAEGRTYDEIVKSCVALLLDGSRKPYSFCAIISGPSKYTEADQSAWSDDDERWDKDGDEWDTEFSGEVLINNKPFAVEIW